MKTSVVRIEPQYPEGFDNRSFKAEFRAEAHTTLGGEELPCKTTAVAWESDYLDVDRIEQICRVAETDVVAVVVFVASKPPDDLHFVGAVQPEALLHYEMRLP